jgi:uncharacterized protein YndB with AHSA1/START domain
MHFPPPSSRPAPRISRAGNSRGPARWPAALERGEWLQRELREYAVRLEGAGRRDTADRIAAVAAELREAIAPDVALPDSGRPEAGYSAVAPSAPRDLVVHRRIEVPPELVFETWTKDLPLWWGPQGTTVPEWRLELVAGGAFHTRLRTPDGIEYQTRGVVLEVTPPSRLVFTDAFEPGWSPGDEAFVTVVVSFEPDGASATECKLAARHWTLANVERHVRMGFYQVWAESLDRLAEQARRRFRLSHE